MSATARSQSPDALAPVARSVDEWKVALESLGERGFRGEQIFRWIHGRGVFEPEQMTDLSKSLRQRLAGEGMTAPAVVTDVRRSRDGTRKLLLDLKRGGLVECVLIPMTREIDDDADDAGDDAAGRVTLCISTQVGCAMGCVFCASGRAGLERGLGADEIAVQVLVARRYLEPAERLTNLVFMGMGEPLHHYDATARSIELLTHPMGAALGARRITVSTVGLVPGIRRLGRDFAGKVGLAVSLHAPNDEIRGRIMPMNRRYPISDLVQALREYPLPRRRRITIEYTLIRDVNDSASNARELMQLLRGLPVKINLIPLNRVPGSELTPPSDRQVTVFQEILARGGYTCLVRRRRGDDVDAACGQLALADKLVRGKEGCSPRS